MKLLCVFIFIIPLSLRAQQPELIDSTLFEIDAEQERIKNEPLYYLLLVENSEPMELTRSEVGLINEKWLSKVAVWTEEEEKKTHGYHGDKTLVLITLKNKWLEQYLNTIGKMR